MSFVMPFRGKQRSDLTPAQAFWGDLTPPGGNTHSGRGWSFYTRLMMCPRRFYFGEIQDIDVERLDGSARGKGRDIGTYSHWLKHTFFGEMGHAPMSEEARDAALAAIDRMRELPGCEDDAAQARELFLGWLEHYSVLDRANYDVVGREVLLSTGVDPSTEYEYTSRLDVVLRAKYPKRKPKERALTIVPQDERVIAALEFKHQTKLSEKMMLAANLNGQLMGELYLAQRHAPADWYLPGGEPRAKAIFYDVTVVKKSPDYLREPVVFTDYEMERWQHSCRSAWALRGFYAAQGWPLWHSACQHRYPGDPPNLCDFHQLCLQGEELDLENLPLGLKRRGLKVIP